MAPKTILFKDKILFFTFFINNTIIIIFMFLCRLILLLFGLSVHVLLWVLTLSFRLYAINFQCILCALSILGKQEMLEYYC